MEHFDERTSNDKYPTLFSKNTPFLVINLANSKYFSNIDSKSEFSSAYEAYYMIQLTYKMCIFS